MKLGDKIAIVTGGARGIGAAIVDRYIAEGARVAVADIAFDHAQQTAARHGDKAFAVSLDVTKLGSIESAVEAVVARWGGVDILVNNAGIFDLAPIVEVSEASWDRLFAVNVKGLFFTLQAVARRMIARGRGGKIINMASQAGPPDRDRSGVAAALGARRCRARRARRRGGCAAPFQPARLAQALSDGQLVRGPSGGELESPLASASPMCRSTVTARSRSNRRCVGYFATPCIGPVP